MSILPGLLAVTENREIRKSQGILKMVRENRENRKISGNKKILLTSDKIKLL